MAPLIEGPIALAPDMGGRKIKRKTPHGRPARMLSWRDGTPSPAPRRAPSAQKNQPVIRTFARPPGQGQCRSGPASGTPLARDSFGGSP